jgi:hypothetical protein
VLQQSLNKKSTVMKLKTCIQSLGMLLVALCLIPLQTLQAQDDVIALSDPVVVTDEYEIYGNAISDDYEITPLKMKSSPDAEKQKEKEYYFEGTLTDVCQARGCNFMLDDGERQVRVRFIDDSFFIPTNTAGKKSLVRGMFVERGENNIEILSSAIKIYR